MLWLLLALMVLVLSLAIFAVTALSLWRAIKLLGQKVSAAGETVEQMTGTLDGTRAPGAHAAGAPAVGTPAAASLGSGPCPTCGAPPRSVGRRPSGVSAPAR